MVGQACLHVEFAPCHRLETFGYGLLAVRPVKTIRNVVMLPARDRGHHEKGTGMSLLRNNKAQECCRQRLGYVRRMEITAGPVEDMPYGIREKVDFDNRGNKQGLDAYKMILVDHHYFGKGAAFKRIFLVTLFFGFYLFGHLAFTIAMKLWPGLVDTIPFVSLLVGKIAQYNNPLTHGLGKQCCNQ